LLEPAEIVYPVWVGDVLQLREQPVEDVQVPSDRQVRVVGVPEYPEAQFEERVEP